ncbi:MULTISPECIES: hypothetical protein [unclassified Pseudoxanthomonas]|uniref:hypothetical protein n=1 Tax=unclassified Pseudoxanthomonas TaxID=2645906 RepID=UPI00160F53E9|nr:MULTISPECIES: hypothetical protein [unclassified Pseudoxanthomonas]MBB3275252.1 hypothetical protein [Pseudoxanthomonas sp. OG2]MBV7473657.1 hypothetical protein [Pseudoxanthomonas sp. PXM05]
MSDPLSTHPPALLRHRREWLAAAILVLLIKGGWLLVDHTLRLYMGDSMVYLQTGAWLSPSPGRSFLYGVLLHFSAFPLHSPIAILALQTALSAATALLLFHFLRHILALRFWICLLATVFYAAEPAQIFFERMVMAETAGQFALVLTVLALSRFLTVGKLRWYLFSCMLGLLAANFRTSLLPVVLGLGLVVPWVKYWLVDKHEKPQKAWRQRLGSLAIALGTLAASHVAYTQIYGIAFKCPPGYLALTGMMRIGLVAPLIQSEHFEGTGVSGDILKRVQLPLSDHWQRGNHIWSSQGLWHELENDSPNPELVARTITRRAMLSNPLGLLEINLETLGGYFDMTRVYWRMQDDIGVIAPDERALELVQGWLEWDARGINTLETPARRFFAASYRWLVFCLFGLVPIALLALVAGWRTPRRPQFFLLGLASVGLVASHLLFAHIVSFRYIHPLPWFMLANIAVLIDAAFNSRYRTVSRLETASAGKPAP